MWKKGVVRVSGVEVTCMDSGTKLSGFEYWPHHCRLCDCGQVWLLQLDHLYNRDVYLSKQLIYDKSLGKSKVDIKFHISVWFNEPPKGHHMMTWKHTLGHSMGSGLFSCFCIFLFQSSQDQNLYQQMKGNLGARCHLARRALDWELELLFKSLFWLISCGIWCWVLACVLLSNGKYGAWRVNRCVLLSPLHWWADWDSEICSQLTQSVKSQLKPRSFSDCPGLSRSPVFSSRCCSEVRILFSYFRSPGIFFKIVLMVMVIHDLSSV